ncbi:MAG: glucosamine-6-phosphate deaminase [Lachnospiraceae bacterium]|nr:glucosamine-6-phosphate deaminase [Lachnospiraceae bacterium]
MRFILAKDYEDMSKKAATIIGAQVILKPSSVLGLATGSSPLGIYKKLIQWCKAGAIDFSKVCSVNLDEYRGLSAEDDQSYNYYMSENFFHEINIDKSNTHLPDGMAKDGEKACVAYEVLIENLGGIDMQLLGIGHNGHIGFNEPAEDFPVITHCVDLAESTIEANKRFFTNIDQVPKQAYTMGIGTIMKAKKIVLIATGEDKADIVAKAFQGDVTPQVPASILQLHSDVTIVGDEKAFAKIKL